MSQVLSIDSLENLRKNVIKNPNLVKTKFDDLISDFDLNFVPFNSDTVDFENFPSLEFPKGTTQQTNKDIENCKSIYQGLTGLTASQATDERFWVTLSFQQYPDYVEARFPLDQARTETNHVSDHWFAKNSRNRFRDNAISRLWWMAHIADKVPEIDIDQALENLFFNSDYRSSLLERNSSANSVDVVAAVLRLTQKARDAGHEYNREKFRTFMKEVGFIGKRTVLPSLTVEELVDLLSKPYEESYEIKLNL